MLGPDNIFLFYLNYQHFLHGIRPALTSALSSSKCESEWNSVLLRIHDETSFQSLLLYLRPLVITVRLKCDVHWALISMIACSTKNLRLCNSPVGPRMTDGWNHNGCPYVSQLFGALIRGCLQNLAVLNLSGNVFTSRLVFLFWMPQWPTELELKHGHRDHPLSPSPTSSM